MPRKIRPKPASPACVTFRMVAEQWTSGGLHKRFPDHVKTKEHDHDWARLERLFGVDVGGRTPGDVPIGAFKIDHADTAMAALPGEARRPATRRAYAQLIHRVLALAVYPCRYIEANPLPKGFLPKIGKPPAYAYLYPTEDAALLRRTEVPLVLRVLYAFLAREGLRAGEGLALSWTDVDLERGVVTLDENKTDDARAWALDPGVARGLQGWRARTKGALLFALEGEPIELPGLALRLRSQLLAAGVDRPELHHSTENRGRFRVHDLRGTFVTLSLANGKTETCRR